MELTLFHTTVIALLVMIAFGVIGIWINTMRFMSDSSFWGIFFTFIAYALLTLVVFFFLSTWITDLLDIPYDSFLKYKSG